MSSVVDSGGGTASPFSELAVGPAHDSNISRAHVRFMGAGVEQLGHDLATDRLLLHVMGTYPGAVSGLRNKWKTLLAEYGRVAIGVYLAIFALVFTGAAIAIHLGFSFEGVAGSAGTLGAAWLATKLTQPIRIIATVALTPLVAPLFRKPQPPPPPPQP